MLKSAVELVREITTPSELLKLMSPDQPWLLDIPDLGISVDETIFQSLETAKFVLPYPYEPRLLEDLLHDVSGLLTKCESYRQAIFELEYQLAQAALQFNASKEIASEQLVLVEKENSSKDLAKYAEAIAQTGLPQDNEAKELAARAELYRANSNRSDSVTTSKRKMAEYSRDLNEALLRLLSEPSRGSNLGERLRQLRTCLKEDIVEAYLKLQAALIGMQSTFTLKNAGDRGLPDVSKLSLPPLGKTNYLDDLILWSRKVIRIYEQIAERDVVADYRVSLIRSLGADKLITESEFRTAIAEGADGKFTANLITCFKSHECVRLLAFGMSITYKSYDESKANGALNIAVFPPRVDAGGAISYRRTSFELSAVAPLDNASDFPQMVSGPGIQNLDPRGEWTFIVNPVMYYRKGPGEALPHRSLLSDVDIVLHLRLRSLPDPDPSKWDWA